MHEIDIAPFRFSANIIGFSFFAAFKQHHQGLGMVIDVQPIADVGAIAIDRQGLPCRQFKIIKGISFSGNW